MADISITSLGHSSCCMLCSNQLYSAGFNIYQARTYHGEKSFYAKLLELTNYTASLPQLASDSLCSVCATMLSQIDQLEFQLSHLISQIRSLFHKMVQSQTEAASRQDRATAAETQQGVPGGAARATSAAATPAASTYVPEVKTEPTSVDPPEHSSYFSKKSAKENGSPSVADGRRLSWTAGAAVPAASSSASTTEDGVFNIGHFLDIREAAASASSAADSASDFASKFVREVDSEDAYRFQCVLCSKMGDCAEAIRQHVRRDHPGADRISFPAGTAAAAAAGTTGAGKRSHHRSSAGAVGKTALGGAAKVPRSITASSPAMAQNIADRAFVCAGCDKAFGCEAFLTRHVTSQHCGRMYGCQYCGKEFSRSDKKVRHERSHTGERPFSCSFCGKAFSRRDKCTHHEKSHTRHRPFECQRCGEVMFSAAAYATHRQSCSDDAQGTGSLWQSAQGRPPPPPPPPSGDADA